MKELELKRLYEKTLLVRLSENQIMKEYFQDEMKTPVHLSVGAEAISAMVTMLMPKETKYFGTYRNHALFLALSEDTDTFFAEMYGRETGCAKGKAGSMHLSCPEHGLIATSAVVGTTIPVAVGAALALKYKKDPNFAVVFFGDGAIEEGVAYECLNFAALQKLPVIFVCEDNGLAIHSPRKDREGFKSIEALVNAFDIKYLHTDMQNPEDAWSRVQEFLADAQATRAPAFLHMDYFRFLEHVGPLEDFDKGYRTKPENANYNADPVLQIRRALESYGVKADYFEACEKVIQEKISKSVDFAKKASFAPISELYTDVLFQK